MGATLFDSTLKQRYMVNYLTHNPTIPHGQAILNHPLLTKIGQVADRLQLETYVIGGFVRDLFLGRVSKDIDIVCVGDGIMLAHNVAKYLNPDLTVTVFKTFGTAMLKWEGWIIEFVGARKESYFSYSRHPLVSSGTLQDFNHQCHGHLLKSSAIRHPIRSI